MSAISKLPKRKKAPARKTLAIDFDGVIYNTDKNELYPDSLSALDTLTRRFDVVVFSSRAVSTAGRQMIIDILGRNDIRVKDVTAVKVIADLYIDDKALYHTSWDRTLLDIGYRLNLPINQV